MSEEDYKNLLYVAIVVLVATIGITVLMNLHRLGYY